MDKHPWGLQHRGVFTCTIWAVVAWEKITLGCSALQCPSSSAWEGKSSPQSSQVKVLSVCLKCSLATWLCRAPGTGKEAEQYKQQNGWEPVGRSAALSLAAARPGLQRSPRAQGAANSQNTQG